MRGRRRLDINIPKKLKEGEKVAREFGRKGTTLDVFFIMIIMMFFGIMVLVSVYLADQIFPMMTDFFGAGEATTIVETAKQGYGALDNIFIFLFFMLNMVPVLVAVLVRHHPIFLVINIIILMIFLVVAPSMSNIMREFWSNPEFAQYAVGGGGSQTFNVMTRVFQYLPYISMGLSVLLMITMFVKSPEQGVTI